MTNIFGKRLKLGMFFSCIITLTACSSVDNETTSVEQQELKLKNEQALAESGYKCKRVKPTGSHIAVNSCTTRQQREERAQDAKKMVGDIVNGAPPPEVQ